MTTPAPQPAPLPTMLHIGHVVHDLAETARQYIARFGATPAGGDMPGANPDGIIPTIDIHFTDATVNGEPADFVARYGFLDLGGIQIELIQPVSGATSPYVTFLAEHGEGVHHLAYVVDSIDAHLATWRTENPDTPLLLEATLGGSSRVVYIGEAVNGLAIELIQMLATPDADA
jgi:methylmalonyl-CoA/ethylmalonyl-CoA epimerase